MPWLPVDEAAERLGVSRGSAWRLIQRYRVPTRKEKRGRTYRTLVDVNLLALVLGKGPIPGADVEALPLPERALPTARPALEAHLSRIAAEARDLPRGLKWDLIKEEAQRLGVTPNHLARLLRRYEAGQLLYARRPRRDRGTHRVPAELRKLVVGLKLAHPRASARRILRIVEANDPGLLLYRPYSTETLFRLSEATVRRILRKAEDNPAFRYALLSEEGRREFARTWAGHVLAEYPMQMVMVDMTRCDVFVYLPEEDRMVRLRIHVALDVYSGAVPSLVFSREESQVPTDQLLILMTQDKTAIVPDWDAGACPSASTGWRARSCRTGRQPRSPGSEASGCGPVGGGAHPGLGAPGRQRPRRPFQPHAPSRSPGLRSPDGGLGAASGVLPAAPVLPGGRLPDGSGLRPGGDGHDARSRLPAADAALAAATGPQGHGDRTSGGSGPR